MRFYGRTVLGLVIAVAALAFFLFGIYQLVRGGSCASGGQYVSTRQCPAGSTAWMFALPPAVLIGLSGLWLIGRRGPRPGAATSYAVPATPYAVPAAPVSDPISRLERLQALMDAGALSPDEFAQAKARILAEM